MTSMPYDVTLRAMETDLTTLQQEKERFQRESETINATLEAIQEECQHGTRIAIGLFVLAIGCLVYASFFITTARFPDELWKLQTGLVGLVVSAICYAGAMLTGRENEPRLNHWKALLDAEDARCAAFRATIARFRHTWGLDDQ